MARMYSEDAYCLGLLYVYLYSNKQQRMVLLNDLKDFHKAIENNLEGMGYSMHATGGCDNDESIYFSSSNKNGETYYILKPEFDLSKAKSLYIGCLPLEYLMASQMNNALSCLGLIKINNKIFVKRNIISERKCDECCSNCDYSISPEMYDDIINENKEYQQMSYEEAIKEIGFCEIHETIDIPRELGYWCPEYIPQEKATEEKLEHGVILKKTR